MQPTRQAAQRITRIRTVAHSPDTPTLASCVWCRTLHAITKEHPQAFQQRNDDVDFFVRLVFSFFFVLFFSLLVSDSVEFVCGDDQCGLEKSKKRQYHQQFEVHRENGQLVARIISF